MTDQNDKLRGLPGLEDVFVFAPYMIDLDFISQEQQEEVRKVLDRYIKKANHKVFIVSTKNRSNKI